METTVDQRRAFLAAYDAVLAKWRIPVEEIDVPTPFGVTRVNACGPSTAPALVLLSGNAMTSTIWLNNARDLATEHRVYAIDQINEAGAGVMDVAPKTREDIMAWLDAIVAGLPFEQADFCGHSYGAWLALSYALHAPTRVRRLVLLDPSKCFAGFAPTYLIHAAPMMLRGGTERTKAFFAWESDGAEFDRDFEHMMSLPAGVKTGPIVMPRQPTVEQLRALDAPVLVLLAERSKMHNVHRVAAKAKKALTNVDVRTLAGATHHTIPSIRPEQLNRELLDFLR